MIVLRKADGSTVALSPKDAVELRDMDGRLAVVIIQDRHEATHVAMPGDALFTAYCRSNGLQPARVHRHTSAPLLSDTNVGLSERGR